MKTILRTSLPDVVSYNGKEYVVNAVISSTMSQSGTSPESVIRALKTTGQSGILVQVLSKSLRGKLNFHNKPYEPTNWIYVERSGE